MEDPRSCLTDCSPSTQRTALNPIIGYKNSTKIAKEALETGRSVYELVLEHGILNKEELDTILSPENMLKPVKLDIKPRR